jgi:hypothetical protein
MAGQNVGGVTMRSGAASAALGHTSSTHAWACIGGERGARALGAHVNERVGAHLKRAWGVCGARRAQAVSRMIFRCCFRGPSKYSVPTVVSARALVCVVRVGNYLVSHSYSTKSAVVTSVAESSGQATSCAASGPTLADGVQNRVQRAQFSLARHVQIEGASSGNGGARRCAGAVGRCAGLARCRAAAAGRPERGPFRPST